jgi:hypothetical protein
MANPDIVRGLQPVSNAYGGAYTGGARVYTTASGDGTAIYVGDPVKLAGTSQTVNGQIYADIAQAAVGNVLVGVVIGVLADTRDSLTYRAASTVRRLLVVDDPNALFEIQEVSGGTALTANDIGLNAPFVVGSGSTTTGYSGVELNNVGEATTNTLDLKIIGLVPRENNAVGENAKWIVRLNNHIYVNQTAGV